MKDGKAPLKLPYFTDPSRLPLHLGDSCDEMILINRDMAEVLDAAGIYHRIRKSSFFTKATLEGVKLLRNSFLLEDSTLIDEAFCRRLHDEMLSLIKTGKIKASPV